MGFQIRGLEEGQFEHLFGADAGILERYGAERVTVDSQPGYPCRITLQDVAINETVLLLNYEHLSAMSPYRSSHAIFVHEGARQAIVPENQVPDMLRSRLLSVRAFDADVMMFDADVVEGCELEPMIERMLSDPSVSFLHVHNARRGCFMAQVDRI